MSKQYDNFEGDLELKLEPSSQPPLFPANDQSVKGKRLVVVLISVILFVVIAYFTTQFLSQNANIPASGEKTNSKNVAHHYSSVMVDFPEIVTNLAPTNDKESYIKLSMTLELNNAKDQDGVDQKLNILKDTIIVFLREVRASDLTSAGGSMMLKTEVTRRVNKILYPIEIKDVLFKEIFVNQ